MAASRSRDSRSVRVPRNRPSSKIGMETDGPRANAVDIGENRLAKCRLALHTGQTPVLKYNRQLMQAILWDRLPIAEIVNVKVIGLEQAPEGYKSFDAGVANK